MKLLIGCLASFHVAHSLLTIDGDTREFFGNLVPSFRSVGHPLVDEKGLRLHIATREEMKGVCGCTSPEEAKYIFNFSEPTVMVIQYTNLPEYWGCDMTWGANTDAFLNFWCAIPSILIFTASIGGYYPGMLANANFGRAGAYQEFTGCSLLETRIETKEDYRFFEELNNSNQSLPLVNIRTNTNFALETFNSPFVILYFRVAVAGVYWYIFFKAIKSLIHHLQSREKKKLQITLLCGNIVGCFILGVLESCGTHYLGNLLPMGVQHYFYTLLQTSSVAGDVLLSIIYSSIASSANKEGSPKYLYAYWFLAIWAVLSEVIIGLIFVYVKATLRMQLVGLISFSQIVLNIIVITILFLQTRKVVNMLKSAQAGISRADERFSKLEIKLRKLIRISAISSVCILMLYAYHGVVGIPLGSPTQWLSYWTLTCGIRCVIAYVQVSACEPVKLSRVSASSNVIQVTSNSVKVTHT